MLSRFQGVNGATRGGGRDTGVENEAPGDRPALSDRQVSIFWISSWAQLESTQGF